MLGPHTKSAKLIGTNECFSRMLFKDLYPWLEVIAVEKKIRHGPCSEIELLRDSLAQKCQISAADLSREGQAPNFVDDHVTLSRGPRIQIQTGDRNDSRRSQEE